MAHRSALRSWVLPQQVSSSTALEWLNPQQETGGDEVAAHASTNALLEMHTDSTSQQSTASIPHSKMSKPPPAAQPGAPASAADGTVDEPFRLSKSSVVNNNYSSFTQWPIPGATNWLLVSVGKVYPCVVVGNVRFMVQDEELTAVRSLFGERAEVTKRTV